MWRRAIVAALAGGILAGTAIADDLPPWVREAMSAPTPADAAGLKAVLLARTGSIEWLGGDNWLEQERRVIRILAPDPGDAANAYANYLRNGRKVRSLRAWVVLPSGTVRELSDKDVADFAMAKNDVYHEARCRMLMGGAEAVAGSTFAWESIVESQVPSAEFDWWFQEDLRTVHAEFSMRPPPGWAARALYLCGDSTAEVPAASSPDGWLRWHRDDMAAIPDDLPLAPPMSYLVPRLAVSVQPPSGTRGTAPRTFDSWAGVSAWLDQISAPSRMATPSILAKAQAIVAGLSDPQAMVRAIASYCQSVNYISIQMGLAKGGGYTPHPADQVLSSNYGDCKDKANLMVTMLRSLHIDAYLCVIDAFDPDYVREAWPTPCQFDHCIVAVRSADSMGVAVETPALGRLALFDPTSTSTSWGDLPATEQGGYALIVAQDNGALVRVPVTASARNMTTKKIQGVVSPEGFLWASVSLGAKGSSASNWRVYLRERGEADVRSNPPAWLGSGTSGASVDTFRTADDGRSFGLHAVFRLGRFGRTLPGSMMVIEPGKLSTLEVPPAETKPRTVPLRLDAVAETEEIRLSLPAGYQLDEVPSPISLDSAYGACEATYSVEDGSVVLQRRIEVKPGVVPAAQVPRAREFLNRVKRAIDIPLVLVKR